MNEKFNKNAKVEKCTIMMGIAVRLIVIDPLETGQLSRHYIAEISLNVTLNHNQPTVVIHISGRAEKIVGELTMVL